MKHLTPDKIVRINELYHKSKSTGLTEDEKKEQADLRVEYRKSIVSNMTQQLGNPDNYKKK